MAVDLKNYFSIDTYNSTVSNYSVIPSKVGSEYRISFDIEVTYETNPSKIEKLECNLKKEDGTTTDLSLQGFTKGNHTTFYLVIPEDYINTSYLNLYFQYWGASRAFTVSDNQGTKGIFVSSSWWNTAPTINGGSGSTVNLGDKNKSFNINYTVDDTDEGDVLTIIEKINGAQIREISNAPRGENLTISITESMLNSYDIDSTNTIQISVSDSSSTIYQYYKFKRVNLPPVITTDQDLELGTQTETMIINYSVNDPEGNSISIKVYLDDKLLRNLGTITQAENTFNFSHDEYIRISNGNHDLKIEATDSLGAVSEKVFTFTKNETVIDFSFKNPIVSDEIITIMQFMIIGEIDAAEMHVYACNNGQDESPTYEEITDSVINNTIYEFTNTTKTAEQWGLKVRATFTRKEGTTDPIVIHGYGGAFE